MKHPKGFQADPRLDLMQEKIVDVPRELVWLAWTTPEYIKQWFTPAPWKTVDCEIDLRPGGIFRTVMRSPQGQEISGNGFILEVVLHGPVIGSRSPLIMISATGPFIPCPAFNPLSYLV